MRAEILGDWSPILGDLHRGWQPASPATQSADKAARCSGDRPREAVSRNGKTDVSNGGGRTLGGGLAYFTDGLGVYCGVADGARGCYVGGAVCGALVAWDGAPQFRGYPGCT